MRKRENFFLTFFLFLIITLLVFIFATTSMGQSASGILEQIVRPFQSTTFSLFHFGSSDNTELTKLKVENAKLSKKLVDQKNLQEENNALKDQFKTQSLGSENLLPAHVLGSPGFLPGESMPEYLILDKGKKDNVRVGQAVIVKESVVGKISKVSQTKSQVKLITDASSLFAAKTVDSSAVGVIKGQGQKDLVLDNVLLSETLNMSDSVVTKGDIDKNGLGYSPNLVVGKIVSLEKKPSSLFQSAKVKSLLDFSRLSTVFIIMNNQ